jgi:hypothetical protein
VGFLLPNGVFKKRGLRAWDFLKRRPYVITIVFVLVFFCLMWVMNREQPYLLSDLPPEVLATARENFCFPEAKFKVLKTNFKYEWQQDGNPFTVTVESIEENIGKGIALRREKYFYDNATWPVQEVREYIVGGLMMLKMDVRQPMPLFGSFLREDGWERSKTSTLKVNQRVGQLNNEGGVCEFEKRVTTEVNDYTGLREDLWQKTRCVVVSRMNAYTIHPRLTGDAYQINCHGERVISTSGGIPEKTKQENLNRVSVYYFIPEWAWVINARRDVNTDSKEYGNLKEHFKLDQFSVE